MKFGDFIRQKREHNGWTQPEAAAKIGIEQSYLSKLETGKSYPAEDIFNKLVETYKIDVKTLGQDIFPAELDHLREIKEVRGVILNRHKLARTIARNWMVAGLICILISGASFGLALIPEQTLTQYHYRSMGVLMPDENLNAFEFENDPTLQNATEEERREARERVRALTERVDPKDAYSVSFKGQNYVETVPEGRRVFHLIDTQELPPNIAFGWFHIPALMFLFGGLGCFFISLRWK